MEDSISTVRQYEVSRVEYDAYRSDLEYYATAPKTEVRSLGLIKELNNVFLVTMGKIHLAKRNIFLDFCGLSAFLSGTDIVIYDNICKLFLPSRQIHLLMLIFVRDDQYFWLQLNKIQMTNMF